MYDSILVPTDGSDEAVMAAKHGVELAAAVGATVHALYVIDLPNAPRTPHIMDDEEEVRATYRAYGREVTDDVSKLAANAGVDCTTVLKSGSIHEEIVDYAEDERMGAIVVGTGYQGKLGALLGTVAETVVRTSTVPVISLREGETD